MNTQRSRSAGWPAGTVAAAVLALAALPGHAHALQSPDAALTGSVTSDAEGPMEGVLVSARRDGSTITITVVSDAAGTYTFPASRLEPGEYAVSVRAVGYVLEPATREVAVRPGRASTLDLRLEEADLLSKALHLSTAEWLMSYPLPEEDVFTLLRDCARCHDHRRVAMSRFTEAELPYVMQRMRYYWLGSTPVTYQLPPDQVVDWGRGRGVMGTDSPTPFDSLQARAVAAINLSSGPWSYPLKTYPRPAGENTDVIYTTYDLPRVINKPHDVQMGPDGRIYYDDFNRQIIGRLDPETGETVEWDLGEMFPQLVDAEAMQNDGNRVITPDGQGRFYITPPGLRRGEGYVVVFDSRTETFEYCGAAGHFSAASSIHVDGYAWMSRAGQVLRVAFPEGGDCIVESVAPGESLPAYDQYVDSGNNVWGASRNSTEFWRVDAETFEVTRYPIPSEPRGETGLGGGSRRGWIDNQDRLWFGGFDGNYVGMLDTADPGRPEFELFPMPMPWFQPYMAQSDNAGYVWTGSISADHVARMNEETGEWNLYLLPGETNIRQIHVEEGERGGLSSLWIGANHQGRIIHIEPLEG